MQNIKKIYLYAVSLISLVMIVIAAVMLINMGLKTWVFTKADTTIYYPISCPPAINTNAGAPPVECIDPGNAKQQQEQERTSQKQRDASQALAMIIVAAPVFYYHWKLARKEV